ncbi:MAG: STAS domain-containing protein, partial [Planctomycetales bacterium]|nr:STAS domain-containing protein [Planctomycetales bacterium]
LATTYVEGDLLSDLARQYTAIEPKQVALLVGKLALAISHMHGAGLVHGHLSPDSIVVEKGGEPVITDLGLAPEFRCRQDDESAAFRRAFIAPEIRESESESAIEKLVPQSDIYSLAAIGFFVLTGRAPVAAGDLYHDGVLDGLDEDAGGEFKQCFSKALAANPAQRYGSARELAAAMDHLYRATPLVYSVAAVADTAASNNVTAKATVADKQAGTVKPPVSENASAQPRFKQFDFQEIDGSHVVHLHDESVLSMESLVQTKREIFAMVEQYDPKRLIVNFASVRFCSSETIGILIQLKTELKPRDTLLYLCGMRDSIREVFRVLNLDGSVFEIRGTVSNALKSLE